MDDRPRNVPLLFELFELFFVLIAYLVEMLRCFNGTEK